MAGEETPEELLATIAELRKEIERLREELRLARRSNAEIPPHYL
jgi:uncharacterized coiled-coil protein SlyX